jgi:radical SAM protein with 4Fe4S-binding SPASM domain
MIYKPITAVWEITMGCNMRCKHCGSSCENALPGELTTEEALGLCDDLGKLGFQWITLSGGEPTIRKDWYLIAKRLNENGIIPNVITNGWLLDEKILDQAVTAGVNTIAISLDGLKETHDYIRKSGSFDRIMTALDLMQRKGGVFYSVITTINHINIHELKAMKEILAPKGVRGWQLQIGLPMGNMARYGELIAKPEHVDLIIDFAYETMKDDTIEVQLADCIGYFNLKEQEVRKKSSRGDGYAWGGCGAGKYNLGILHNGDILGCTSVRDRSFIEGNIRETPIKEIWENPDNFSWNRNLTKSQLGGFCSKCKYGQQCLGGCGNTRLTMSGDIYGENNYCSYHAAVSIARAQFAAIDDVDELIAKARKFADKGNFQLAELLLSRAMEKGQSNPELLNFYGFVSFMLGNYQDSKNATEKVLALKPGDAYALKGLGLSIARLGEVEEGIAYLRKAIAAASEDFLDPYHDLAVVLAENGRKEEALAVLREGMNKSQDFAAKNEEFYQLLTGEAVADGKAE